MPVSQPCVVGDDGGSEGGGPASTPTNGDGPGNVQWCSTASAATEALKLERYRVGNFATGVLTNLMQLQTWAYPTDTAIDDDDSGDESDGDRWWGSSVSDGLPFHPAFMDAAMLTLSTPKWPLLLDPEGIALRHVKLCDWLTWSYCPQLQEPLRNNTDRVGTRALLRLLMNSVQY